MKLENKIKKYIKLIRQTDNIVDRSWYLTKLNKYKSEIIDILCQHPGFFNIYYNTSDIEIGNLNKYEFIENFYKTYSIKKIYIGLDKNCNTQITNIEFDI